MYSTRLVQLLFVALGFTTLTQATVKYDESGIMIPRQEDLGDDGLLGDILPGETPSATPSATATSEPDDPVSTTATEEEDPVSTSEVQSATTTDPKTSEKPTETPTTEVPTKTKEEEETTLKTTAKPKPTATKSEDDDDKDDKPSKTTLEPVTSTSIEVVTKTNEDGSHQVMTTSHITTSTPEPQEGDSDDNGGGLSPNTRNIVIGVVVGVGGAILLGALGLVAWRIRSRKKAAEESESLMEYTSGYATVDKSEPPNSATGTNASSAGRSPFQATLDTYHQPNQINTSSNF